MGEICIICGDSSSSSTVISTFGCEHSVCHSCLINYLNTTITSWIGITPSDIRLTCPGACFGRRCSFPLDQDFVYHLLPNTSPGFQRLDDILYRKLVQTTFPEYRPCSKCIPGYAIQIDCDKEWFTCQHPDCKFQFCSSCELGRTIHEGKTCLQLKDTMTPKEDSKKSKYCPSCRAPTEKIFGCDHITCTNCGYEWCWICAAAYSTGHLQTHRSINVNVPGKPFPLQIMPTEHSIYERQTTGVTKRKIEGQAIYDLFSHYDTVKMVKLTTIDPITGQSVATEGLLLKKRNTGPVGPASE